MDRFSRLLGEFSRKKSEAKLVQQINKSDLSKGKTTNYRDDSVYIDPRNEKLGAKIISKLENLHLTIKKLSLTIVDKKKYYNKSFELGIPQIDLDKLRDKIFGIENNLDELKGIDFKKGCYIGQENTSRIKLRNKLRRRLLPVHKITGEVSENEIIKYGEEILRKNNSVKLIGNPKNRGGVLSFNIDGIHPHDIATVLDEDGVAIRAGHHCCQILHKKLNLTASARASVGIYNTKEDFEKLNESINKCKKVFDI